MEELEKISKEELVSRYKRIEAENVSLKNQQKEIWDNIKMLITKISHEMKTPLNSIMGFCELLKCKTSDKTLFSYSDKILTSSNYLLSLIQNMIDISKFQQNNLKLSYSIFNTKSAIEEVLSEFPKLDIDYTIIDATISADYLRFKQVVYNLISNAIKYGRNNPINIITYIDKDYFCFEISDKGEGIKKEDFEKIFELYTQVSSYSNKRQLGLGIGLALCKVIIQAHNGIISVFSEIDKGSSFVFKIPISPIIKML